MIKRIEIRNFQAHKRLAINFSKEVTTIVGPSDVGKSAVIRALGLVVFNRPGGESFITEGAKRCSIKLFLESGETIYREKGRQNIYKIGDKELKAFGKGDPPEEVKALLNLSEINFQGQHDSPYWFCETAGEVSRQLNRIVNLGVIDRTLNNITSDIRKAKTKKEVHEDQLKTITEDLKAVDHAQDMHEALQRAEKAKAQYEETRANHSKALELVEKVKTHRDTQERLIGAAEAASLVVKRGKAWGKIGLDRADMERGIRKIVHGVALAEAAPPKETMAILAGVHRKYKLAGGAVFELRTGIKKIEELEREECRLKEDEEAAKKKLAGMVKTCPTCGKPVT